jgi:hypothetical protein
VLHKIKRGRQHGRLSFLLGERTAARDPKKQGHHHTAAAGLKSFKHGFEMERFRSH